MSNLLGPENETLTLRILACNDIVNGKILVMSYRMMFMLPIHVILYYLIMCYCNYNTLYTK